VLFESAAHLYRQRLMGILLTGANQDGAAGLAAVQDYGGVGMVQEPHSARAPQMVLSALQLRPASLVLPLERIASLLTTLATAAFA
jgi:two-component system chemotaxis response regulator CheB